MVLKSKKESINAYIGLGSNLGQPEENLLSAINEIQSLEGVRITKKSRVYWTEPQGFKEQPWFANQVIEVSCARMWTPHNLLTALLTIEKRLGRKRFQKWEPRNIDLDLLLFDQEVMTTEFLTLPHPELKNRAFVLVPLLEISPDLQLPDQTRIKDIIQNLSYKFKEKRIWQD